VPISVTCEQCGRTFRVADDKAGRQFHCKECGSLVLIPSASTPTDPWPNELEDNDAGDDEYGNPVPPRLIRAPKSTIRPAGKRELERGRQLFDAGKGASLSLIPFGKQGGAARLRVLQAGVPCGGPRE
jgi:DNA-directed RNA polymerase subunit RPC12/RpoP